LPLVLITDLEVPGKALKQEKERKGIQLGKEGGRQCLFTDDMTLYFGCPTESR
jgi:hypothetical protein